MKLVLLHDTDVSDFAGDILGFLQALGLNVSTVMLAPNQGRTLAEKERAVLNQAEGYIFLLTPGSQRHGQDGFASQSVCDELGKADVRFAATPAKVIYLADSRWRAHGIFQKAYIEFNRTDHRSMVRAMRDLVKDLRTAGAFAPPPPAAAKAPTIAEVAERTPFEIKKALKFFAEAKDTIVSDEGLTWYLRQNTKNQTDANLLKRDLVGREWIKRAGSSYFLSPIGMEVVRYERDKPPPPPSAFDLARMLSMYGPLALPPQKPPDKK